MARAWVEVDLPTLRKNYQSIQRVVGPGVAIIVMVKADGYGVGAARVVRALEPLAPRGYGVATVEEGVALRRAGVRRSILVCEPLPPASIEAAAAAGLTPSISHLSQLDHWAKVAARYPAGLDFHIDIDTGMGRCGLDWRDAGEWGAEIIRRMGPELHWAGAFTHFHSADEADASSSMAQWDRFNTALEALPVSRGNLMVHSANSAAALRFPACRADAVRPGIFLYGGDPVPELDGDALVRPELAIALRSRIILVRDVPPGTTVGYGATYRARGPERWATLGIGYGDGLPRSLSNRGVALVRGRRVPMVGRISMDLVVVNVTGVPHVEVGEIATLIGRDGEMEITLEEVAARAGTINHEILTGLTARLPRVESSDARDS